MTGRRVPESSLLPATIQVEHATPDSGETVSARDPYVERYWLPVLGPTSLVIVRRFAFDALTAPMTRYETETLASELGVSAPTFARAMGRLCRFDLAYAIRDSREPRSWWSVLAMIPVVNPKHYRRLPDVLADELASAR